MEVVHGDHPQNNVPDTVKERIPRRLLQAENHPLQILTREIEQFWTNLPPGSKGTPQPRFKLFTNLSPVVTIEQNFDELLIPDDHVMRSPSDTFYVNDTHLLRCHTSAHQTELIRAGEGAFLVAADVYRRDTIDASHYPVFHQMEGVRVFTDEEVDPSLPREEKVKIVVQDLKTNLEGMARRLFGQHSEMRWVDAYFPFTDPSFELEVFFEGEWLEVLGCGMIHQDILRNCDRGDRVGWAFGLGLERLAMVLFNIPDIRLFWTEDRRFLDQFSSGRPDVKFAPYSKFPPVYKDITFWLPSEHWHAHDFFELLRSVAGDLVENVELLDEFTHPKSGRTSHCYRVTYRSMDRSLTHEEINELQEQVRRRAEQDLGVELR